MKRLPEGFETWAVREKVQFLASQPEAKANPEIVQQLQELLAVTRENGLWMWRPYAPKQVAYLESRERVKLFAGGNGTGKSTVGTADDLIQLVDEQSLPEALRRFKRWEPPVPLRVVAPTESVLISTVLEKFRDLAPRDQLVGDSFDKAYNMATRKLSFKNGSWVLFNTAVQDRQAHAGVELRRCRFDEEPPGDHGKSLYTENVARLRSFVPDADIAFTMTPLAGLSWTFDEIYERRGLEESSGIFRNPERSVFVVVASMFDNPHINAQEMIAALSHLPPEELASVVEGRYMHIHGSVLTVTDEHLVDPIGPEHLVGQDVYVGIDPGIRRGGVCWNAFDRDNVQVVFDELYPGSQTIPEIAFDIKVKNARYGLGDQAERRSAMAYAKDRRMRDLMTADEFEDAMTVLDKRPGRNPFYIVDPSMRNRQLGTGESVEAMLQEQGICPVPGQNDRDAGIMQLQSRLAHRGLFVTRNCTNWRREAQRWLVAADEIVSEGKAKVKGAGGRFATIGPDHLMDPTRYVAMERLWQPSVEAPQPKGWDPTSGTAPPASLMLQPIPETVGPMGSFS